MLVMLQGTLLLLLTLVHSSHIINPVVVSEIQPLSLYCQRKDLSTSAGFYGLQRPYCHNGSTEVGRCPVTIGLLHVREEYKEFWTFLRLGHDDQAVAAVGRRYADKTIREEDERILMEVTANNRGLILYVDGETAQIFVHAHRKLEVSDSAFFVLAYGLKEDHSETIKCLETIRTAARVLKKAEPISLVWLVGRLEAAPCKSIVLIFTRPVSNLIGCTANVDRPDADVTNHAEVYTTYMSHLYSPVPTVSDY